MSETIHDGDRLVPSELERQQIFHLMQKVSSITAWRRILLLYKAWADVTKASWHEALKQGWEEQTSLPSSELNFILEGFVAFKKGLLKLEEKNFKRFAALPLEDFIEAHRRLHLQLSTLNRVDDGENGIDEAHTPRWQEYCEAMNAVFDAWQECSMHISAHPHFNGGLWYYNRWLIRDLQLMHFPPVLPAVPDPAIDILVRAEDFVPYAGIWEPVAAPASSWRDHFTDSWRPRPPFTVVGAMKYFSARSRAPGIMLAQDTDSNNADVKLDMAWRLLWIEDRYTDGTIPEQEAQYQFLEPERSHPKSSPADGAGEVWAWSGAAAPASGRWRDEADGSYTHLRKQGQRMGFSYGRPVRWILQEPRRIVPRVTPTVSPDNS
ncbi:MAG: Imm71 family immunity protein [Duganella sp.]